MGNIPDTITAMGKKLLYLVLQYGYIALCWILKLLKVQLQKWRKCGAQKKVDKALSGLGAEIYSLHKQGETDWHAMPSVQQLMQHVEEVESGVFLVNEAVEGIRNEFLRKKEEIKEKYAGKRAEAAKTGSDESGE